MLPNLGINFKVVSLRAVDWIFVLSIQLPWGVGLGINLINFEMSHTLEGMILS